VYKTDPRALEEQRIKIRSEIPGKLQGITAKYSAETVSAFGQHLLLSKSSVLMKGKNVLQRINMTQLNQ
jgi:hypothetical protein